jgi:hypothetical protein
LTPNQARSTLSSTPSADRPWHDPFRSSDGAVDSSPFRNRPIRTRQLNTGLTQRFSSSPPTAMD